MNILTEINHLKERLDAFRPLPPEQVRNLAEAYEVEYTYESNRLEGNTLTLQETTLVVLKGITVGGKSMREHLEAINHQEAIAYLKELATQQGLNERMVKELHALILRGIDQKNAGIYRKINVRIAGSRHLPPDALQVNDHMQAYFAYYEGQKNSLHPLLLSADLHQKLVHIHPFIDGNGRTARLVMNFILLQHGFPLANIAADKRLDYYSTLEIAHLQGDNEQFRNFIAQEVKLSLESYLKVLGGRR